METQPTVDGGPSTADGQPSHVITEVLEPPPAAPAPAGLGELEELAEPLEAGPEPLPEGTEVALPDGARLRIGRHLGTDRGTLAYAAEVEGTGPVRLRALPVDAADRLRAEAELLSSLAHPAFPRVVAAGEAEGAYYLATSTTDAPTLAVRLAEGGMAPAKLLSLLAQAAHAVAHLHTRGWVHGGLRPSVLALDRPLRITDLGDAVRIGERPVQPLYHAGYSAPELLDEGPLDPRADVYSLGAVLYHAVNGSAVSETGAALAGWLPPVPVAGVPQVLARCLGEPESRYGSMRELHADLLRLVRRHAPVARHAVAGASTIGLEPGRRTNQDAHGWLTGRVEADPGTGAWTILCVADGMGGLEAGEAASEAAVRRVLAEAAGTGALPSNEDQARIACAWMQAANESACAALERRGARGGTTLVLALVAGRRLALAHVGDCRLYLLRGEEIQALTRDHSLVMERVRQGEIPIEALRTHPERSTVTRSLGERHPLPEFWIDTLATTGEAPTLELQAGDVLLLCSDGLWEPVLEPELLAAARETAPDLDAAARRLLRLALERGAPDNATVLLFRLDLEPVQPEPLPPVKGI